MVVVRCSQRLTGGLEGGLTHKVPASALCSSVEEKRKQRMKKAGKVKEKAETFESLVWGGEGRGGEGKGGKRRGGEGRGGKRGGGVCLVCCGVAVLCQLCVFSVTRKLNWRVVKVR